MDNFYDAVVVGGGPAGLAAAIYLARSKYRVLVVEKESFGGQITITSEVVNYPGVAKTSGRQLTQTMRDQAEGFGAEFQLARVTSLELDGDIKVVKTDKGLLECFAVLLATGAHPRMVGFKGEEEFRGRGVAYCATCDGEFFTGKQVFVVGGGFAAAEEAVFLTKYASHVTILIRGKDFSCAKSTADEAKANPKISVLYNTQVQQVAGDERLQSITYKNSVTGEETTFSEDGFGVFVFAGYSPETSLVEGLVDLDHGYVVVDRGQKTSVQGVWAAGDVCIKNLRQVVTAVGDGAVAATEIEKYAAAMQKKTGRKPILPDASKHKSVPAAPPAADEAVAQDDADGVFSTQVKQQLETVFSRMTGRVVLKVYLDQSDAAQQLEQYARQLEAMTDKVTVEAVHGSAGESDELPCVKVCREGEDDAVFAFHGVPGGHEFTSFVLGLYNVAGPGQPIADDTKRRIEVIAHPVHFDVMVSLSCTMCPDLVLSVERIAALNPLVTADVYDLNLFPDRRARYNVMSVPCFVINGGKPMFGKKNTEELLSLLGA